MRICATPLLQERRRHVQRRAAVAQGSRDGYFPALFAAWTCQRLSLRGVFRPNALNVRLRNVQQRLMRSAWFSRCPQRSTRSRAIPQRPMHSTCVCAALFIVALAPHGGRKGQENYTASRALILGATPARRDTQRERMPDSPSERCTGRRRANWSWCS